MSSKKKLLEKSCLYLIVDKKIARNQSLSNIVNKIKYCGADIVQYRDKESKKEGILKNAFLLQKSLLNTKRIFIINDYLDVAKIVNSDGIHLGQDDTSIEIVRKVLGRDKIIGISCHNLKQALAAQKKGADYIAIGPVFVTSIKPEYKPIGLNLIKQLKAKIKIPFFAVGGINLSNINKVIFFGAKRVAICKAILETKNISSKVKIFSKILHKGLKKTIF